VKVSAVLFDFGGVLAEEGFRDGLMALARAQGLDPASVAREGTRAVYDSGFVLGKGTAADFWALLRGRTGLAGADDDLSKCILDGFLLRPWMIALVERLRGLGYVTGILSDQTYWLDALDARDRFFQAFDHVFNSYYLGKGKREASLFAEVARDLGLPPAAILFVDDDAGNVARARAAGLHAIRFADRRDFEFRLEAMLGPGLLPRAAAPAKR
jgi:putative hydrolase of the HAD superfamily